jgi:hypothetical protein
MAGLNLTLPAASGSLNQALLTLTVPNPYATGSDNPGGMFGISVNGAVLVPIACFTYCEKAPPTFGRMPTSLAVLVKLTSNTQAVGAVWQSVRSSNVIIDTPASLSAIIA